MAAIRSLAWPVAGALLLIPALPAATARAVPAKAAEPRTILALYDGVFVTSPRFTAIHALAEMPLNHLGLRVQYHDIRGGLPPVETMASVRGVLTWFRRDVMPQPREYLRWLETVAAAGKPLVVIGAIGAFADEEGRLVSRDDVNRVISRFGWSYEGGWTTTTHGTRYLRVDPELLGFERPLPTVIPSYMRVAAGQGVDVGLRVGAARGGTQAESALVVIGPHGAYVAPEFAYFTDETGAHEFRQWYINPFTLFRRAFRTEQLPKADTTTLSGRRIYYSHIDGDGWRNVTQIEPYRTRYVISARLVLEKILRATPDLPVTVGAIGGDIDPQWYGSAQSIATAREIYALPQVEAATHSYSHPLAWRRFDASVPADNREAAATDQFGGGSEAIQDGDVKPRMYDLKPFTVTGEVDDAARAVEALLPPGKRVRLMQWSGDTRPFEQVLGRVRTLGLANINGGDTRYDREFPSAAWVAPIGLRVGRELQIYASNSNENTYTDLWRDRFFGFSFLTSTVLKTGAPRRLKPFNLYYHMFSGERLSSLNAVLANIAYARSLPLAPIEASRFSRIAAGFFSAEFDAIGDRSWRVRNRGDLQTVRFDAATLDGVDFARSTGLVGQRHELGSLFVTLDEDAAEPVVTLKRIVPAAGEPAEAVAYLVESRWRVHGLKRGAQTVRFTTEGFGPGEATWQWPVPGTVRVRWRAASGASGELRATVAADGRLAYSLPPSTAAPLDVVLEQDR